MNDIEIKGLDGIIKRLEELSQANTYEKAMEKCCLLVERDAKQAAPSKTGGAGLRGSIESSVETSGGEIVGVVGSNLKYAPYVEFGTGLFSSKGDGRKTPWSYQDDEGNWHTTAGQHPQPFLAPTVNGNRSKIVEILKDALKEEGND